MRFEVALGQASGSPLVGDLFHLASTVQSFPRILYEYRSVSSIMNKPGFLNEYMADAEVEASSTFVRIQLITYGPYTGLSWPCQVEDNNRELMLVAPQNS